MALRFSVNQILDLSSFFVHRILDFQLELLLQHTFGRNYSRSTHARLFFFPWFEGFQQFDSTRPLEFVKPNIRQRYKSEPPDALEIHQKAVLKWNLENYESPNHLVQQGFFFSLFADPIFSVASSSINRLWVCGLAVCWSWERPDLLPVCVNQQTCTFKKEVILMSVPRLLFSCAVVRYLNDVSDQTREDWMSGFYATDPQLSTLPADRRHSCLNGGYGEQMTQRNAPRCGQTIHVCLHAESQNNGTCVREVLVFRHGWRLQWWRQWQGRRGLNRACLKRD